MREGVRDWERGEGNNRQKEREGEIGREGRGRTDRKRGREGGRERGG